MVSFIMVRMFDPIGLQWAKIDSFRLTYRFVSFENIFKKYARTSDISVDVLGLGEHHVIYALDIFHFERRFQL